MAIEFPIWKKWRLQVLTGRYEGQYRVGIFPIYYSEEDEGWITRKWWIFNLPF